MHDLLLFDMYPLNEHHDSLMIPLQKGSRVHDSWQQGVLHSSH